MPIQDSIQILVPRAADVGNGLIQTREYLPVIYVRRENAFITLQIEKISYSPSWAKVQAVLYESGIESVRTSGANGLIDLQSTVNDTEPKAVGIENLSIDTEVRFTIRFRSWQYGES
jgi:hypothetical protein